jgi:hypothetical protein
MGRCNCQDSVPCPTKAQPSSRRTSRARLSPSGRHPGSQAAGSAASRIALETFIRREDAERFIEEVRGDDPDLAAKLRIEERELDAGGLN